MRLVAAHHDHLRRRAAGQDLPGKARMKLGKPR
jgi:hypothetical protein